MHTRSQRDLPAKSSQFSTLRPTKLDIIKNFLHHVRFGGLDGPGWLGPSSGAGEWAAAGRTPTNVEGPPVFLVSPRPRFSCACAHSIPKGGPGYTLVRKSRGRGGPRHRVDTTPRAVYYAATTDGVDPMESLEPAEEALDRVCGDGRPRGHTTAPSSARASTVGSSRTAPQRFILV